MKKRMMNLMKNKILLFLAFFGMFLVSCGQQDYPTDYPESPSHTQADILWPSALETQVFSDGVLAMVDYSQVEQGYISAKRLSDAGICKLQIAKEDKKYNYDLTKTEYVSFPLQMGNGIYTLKILQQVEGTKYAVCASQEINVQLNDDKQCYLVPNQVVYYQPSSKVVSMSFEQTKEDTDDLTRVYHLFQYTIDTLDYDYKKADDVSDTYVLPDIDEAIDKKSGICFDYASMMAALCRVQGIPVKVIVGWTDIEYHAWVEVYLEHEGWINPKIYFEQKQWTLMDPTFADSKNADYEGKYEEVYRY